jgi:hypothetical protein
LFFNALFCQPMVIGPGSYSVGADGRFMPTGPVRQPVAMPQQNNQQPAQPTENNVQAQVASQPVPVNTNLEVRGCIRRQMSTDLVPPMRILFDGKETVSNAEGFFSFPVDDRDVEKYSLVICKTIKQNFDKRNTLKNVSIIPSKDYRYFSFKRNALGMGWQQREKTLNKKNFVIPQRCIVALIDPKFIDRVEPWNLSLPHNIIKLPAIVIKNDLDKKVLSRAAAKSILYSLDSAVFHEPVKEIIKRPAQNNKVAISLMQ